MRRRSGTPYLSPACYDLPCAGLNAGDAPALITCIKSKDVRIVLPCAVKKPQCYNTLILLEDAGMFGYLAVIRHAEIRAAPAETDQSADIFYTAAEFFGPQPVNRIDGVRRTVAVPDTVLCAQEFLAKLDLGDPQRQEHHRCCKVAAPMQPEYIFLRHTQLQLVKKGVIIMDFHILHTLGGITEIMRLIIPAQHFAGDNFFSTLTSGSESP